MYNPKKFAYMTNKILLLLGTEKKEYIFAFFCTDGTPKEYLKVSEGNFFSCPFPQCKMDEISDICRKKNYDGIVLVHNHPTLKIFDLLNDLSFKLFRINLIETGIASGADYYLTHSLKYNLWLHNITLLDHVIVTRQKALSFLSNKYFVQDKLKEDHDD